ncbi:sigma-54-dependent transcriptional regulator [Aestuariispira insulae]|uniref:Two-component system C4-dicarboxylate transport response regulator DctD n=1 Tax=Aestuariispira insulae TaxID=1461337 RepID=A0A3D9HSK0_9PROT|nr:sigma-54 dependent transcriptional regulator [Aestuariispira insulae]RED52321.1 two-component system C4-dicarboxylate transport response regulator DctD [Aestuariispira insulae]
MENMGHVLFVDDEAAMRESVAQYLGLAGYSVTDLGPGDDILSRIATDFDGILVTDVKMPGLNGLDLMRQALAIDPDLPVIVITGHGDVAMAVEAMRDGAYDFVEKPFPPDRIANGVRRACEKRRLTLELRRLQGTSASAEQEISRRLVGTSAAIQALREEILYLADSDSSVLIQGETGSGKEVVARCLHDLGHRATGNFVALNSAALPENLIEAEMFGNEAGAFTGAGNLRVGRIEHASGGSLFLDEVESMPLSLQSKLLRALEDRAIERLGSNKRIPVDIRLMAASKANLVEESERGRFRADLYYRLNVAELTLPPLRDRAEDIPLLFEHFLDRFRNGETDRGTLPLSLSENRVLVDYDWPGNVRELKNIAERFCLARRRDPSVQLATLLTRQTHSNVEEAGDLASRMRRHEKRLIGESLLRHQGNILSVMEELSLPRRTLNEKMQKLGLKREDFL